METLTIEIDNPKAKRLIGDFVELGLISVKEAKPSWSERWRQLSETLPKDASLSEQEIMEEIAESRKRKI